MASTQLIHDATIVTVDQAGSILYGAALAVSDGRIAALGPTPELLVKYPDAERVDGRGRSRSIRRSPRRAWRGSPTSTRAGTARATGGSPRGLPPGRPTCARRVSWIGCGSFSPSSGRSRPCI